MDIYKFHKKETVLIKKIIILCIVISGFFWINTSAYSQFYSFNQNQTTKPQTQNSSQSFHQITPAARHLYSLGAEISSSPSFDTSTQETYRKCVENGLRAKNCLAKRGVEYTTCYNSIRIECSNRLRMSRSSSAGGYFSTAFSAEQDAGGGGRVMKDLEILEEMINIFKDHVEKALDDSDYINRRSTDEHTEYELYIRSCYFLEGQRKIIEEIYETIEDKLEGDINKNTEDKLDDLKDTFRDLEDDLNDIHDELPYNYRCQRLDL